MLCEAVLLLFTAKVVPGVTIDDVDLNCIADIWRIPGNSMKGLRCWRLWAMESQENMRRARRRALAAVGHGPLGRSLVLS